MNDTVQIPLSENTITSTNESSTTDTTANVSVTQTNATGSETNETIPPSLLVDITYPEKVTRGQTIEVKAVITNTWPEISNVVTEWLLPQGFEILSKQENCNSLASNASCESVILLSSTNAELGLNQAKVVVNYG